MITHKKQLDSVLRTVQDLQKVKYFGRMMCQFADGNVVMIRLEQTVHPEALLDGAPLVVAPGEPVPEQ